MKYIKLFEQYNTDNISQYLGYFEDEGIAVKNVKVGGKGEYSQTYIINDLYAVNVRSEGNASLYEKLIYSDYDHLPTVYDVRIAEDDMICIVMEILTSISEKEKEIIDAVDFLFYMFNKDALDIYLEDNIRCDLVEVVTKLLKKTTQKKVISAASQENANKYIALMKDLKENIDKYSSFIYKIQDAFIEYKSIFRFSYTDFHGDNLMKDSYGRYKLIDL